jgi:hypothetical protein
MATSKHRYGMSGFQVTETEKHGRQMAQERYGVPQYRDSPPADPPDESRPQARDDRRGKSGEVPPRLWLRGGGKGGESNPNFVPTRTGRR